MGAWLVVGLGNPGARYAQTRHNIGAWVVEHLAERLGGGLRKVRFVPIHVAEATVDVERVYLARPVSFMNESGPPVASFVKKRDLDPGRIVAIHDEIDLLLGALRLKKGGSTAGHRGLDSLVRALRTPDFYRVRLGVGRPRGRQEPADYVLEPFAKVEREEADLLVQDAAEAVLTLIKDGLAAAQDRFNRPGPKD